jgi:hypothetical protein
MKKLKPPVPVNDCAPQSPEGEPQEATGDEDDLMKRDRVGKAGDLLGVAAGATAGASIAGVVAGAAGATTLLGSTALAGVLGGVFVTTTPVGWVVGAAAAGAVAAVGITKLIRSGATQDQIRADLRARILKKTGPTVSPAIRRRLDEVIARAVEVKKLQQTQAERIQRLVANGSLQISIALERVEGLYSGGQSESS